MYLIPFNYFFKYLSLGTALGRTIAYTIFGFCLYDICLNTIYKNIGYIKRRSCIIIFLIFVFLMLVLHVYTSNLNVTIDINNLIFYSIGFWIGVTLNKKVRYFIKYKKINITIQQKNHID